MSPTEDVHGPASQPQGGSGAAAAGPGTAAPAIPATLGQKVWLVLGLIVSSVIVVRVWFVYMDKLEVLIQTKSTVQWTLPDLPTLKPGPPNFWFDPKSRTFFLRGGVDSQAKEALNGLLDGGDAAVVGAYHAAIDQLVFEANDGLSNFLAELLIVGGISGLLGVQLRSLINFVGVACFKQALDVRTFWPWYVVRPFTGFILGLVVVLITRAGLFQPSGQGQAVGTLWWVAVALLAGFGADEFTQRLRRLTQTLFGDGKSHG